jgi:tetratricopeptide (TPR) repeat protein
VAKKALVLETKKTDGELKKKHLKLKPWQSDTPIHSAFLERIKRELIKQIETPKQELEMAIFRRGLEKLIKEMRETKDMYEKRTAQEKIPNWRVVLNKFLKKIGLDLLFEQKRIVDLLQIPKLKEELAAVRESGDLVQISAKEREIADRIQEVISNFPRKDPGNNPSEMVVDQYINCVGASILGGALMKEVGLNYLVGDVPRHSILFLVTSDGRVEWRDMLYPPSSKEYLTNKIIKGQREDGKPLTVKDIVAFSKKPKPTGLRFDINSPMYREKLKWVKENQRQYVTVFGPEYGQYVQLLNNTGIALLSLGRHEEALEAYRQAIKLDPKYISPYNNLGNVLRFLGRDEEAIKAYQKAISIDPKYVTPYNGLGNALRSLGRHEEALEAYRQAIKLDPCYALPYNGLGNVLHFLGRYKEAIRAYKKFIKLANSKEDYYLIERAKKVISEMEKVK